MKGQLAFVGALLLTVAATTKVAAEEEWSEEFDDLNTVSLARTSLRRPKVEEQDLPSSRADLCWG
jgi:hypothetical protein